MQNCRALWRSFKNWVTLSSAVEDVFLTPSDFQPCFVSTAEVKNHIGPLSVGSYHVPDVYLSKLNISSFFVINKVQILKDKYVCNILN